MEKDNSDLRIQVNQAHAQAIEMWEKMAEKERVNLQLSASLEGMRPTYSMELERRQRDTFAHLLRTTQQELQQRRVEQPQQPQEEEQPQEVQRPQDKQPEEKPQKQRTQERQPQEEQQQQSQDQQPQQEPQQQQRVEQQPQEQEKQQPQPSQEHKQPQQQQSQHRVGPSAPHPSPDAVADPRLLLLQIIKQLRQSHFRRFDLINALTEPQKRLLAEERIPTKQQVEKKVSNMLRSLSEDRLIRNPLPRVDKTMVLDRRADNPSSLFRRQKAEEMHVRDLAGDVAAGLTYLREEASPGETVLHRDLKPRIFLALTSLRARHITPLVPLGQGSFGTMWNVQRNGVSYAAKIVQLPEEAAARARVYED
ncbi:hypothetical protein CF327_g7635 [Tilletia walkeri]|nr:hypothetical protein CF327_g7635 [Tilletia walkeri]